MNDTNLPAGKPADQPDAATKRAAQIADLYSFVAFLSRNSWAPLPYLTMQADLQRDAPDIWNGGAEGIAELRRIADALGEKPNESGDDRTSVDHRFGSVSYHVVSWHKNGRPGEPVVPDEREDELERLRAEVAKLRAARASRKPVVSRFGGPPADATGLGYSREADDPTPISPDRVPPHTGSTVRDSELVIDPTPTGPSLVPAPIAKHYETSGWTGPGSSSGAACACGVTFDGFATLTEAGAVLDAHIANPVVEPPVHLEVAGAKTMCSLAIIDLPAGVGWTNDHAAVTCKACIDSAPF